MTINETIQSTLLSACSGITSNVYYYLIAVTKEFSNADTLITYELQNNSNTNTAEFRNAIKNYDVTIKITAPTQAKIQSLRVFITSKMLQLTGNVGYISLTAEEQPIYIPENMMFSSSITFNVLWIS